MVLSTLGLTSRPTLNYWLGVINELFGMPKSVVAYYSQFRTLHMT